LLIYIYITVNKKNNNKEKKTKKQWHIQIIALSSYISKKNSNIAETMGTNKYKLREYNIKIQPCQPGQYEY